MASGVLVQDILISMLSMYLVFVISEVVHYLIFNHGYSSNRDTKDIQDISKHFSKEVEKYMGPFMDIISVDSTDPLKTKRGTTFPLSDGCTFIRIMAKCVALQEP